jgi:hypothetical protein
MATTRNELGNDKREERPQQMREQVSSGSLVVGQLTASERRLWEERATSFYEHSDPGERRRKDAARSRKSSE